MNEQAPKEIQEKASSQAGLASYERERNHRAGQQVMAAMADAQKFEGETGPSMPQGEPRPDMITEVPGVTPKEEVAVDAPEIITSDQVPKA